MCEKPLLRATRVKGGYNFSGLFDGTKALFSESNLVVGNLETVFAGESAGYTRQLYSFNTPDAFLDSLGTSGVHLALTANNHCLDRGVEGLRRTLEQLDRHGLWHTGVTFEKGRNYFVKNIAGVRLAVYALTASTNFYENRVSVNLDSDCHVNLARPNNENAYNGLLHSDYSPSWKSRLPVSDTTRIRINKLLGRPFNKSRSDDYWDKESLKPYAHKMKEDLFSARNEADYVIVCPHMGGQFNLQPGAFSNYMMSFLTANGADAVIASHPHIVQKLEWRNDKPCMFSLGNYSISPSSPYVLHENLPEYSIIMHLYVGDGNPKFSFSILKILEDKRHRLRICPVDELYQELIDAKNKNQLVKDATVIYNRVTSRNIRQVEMAREYELSN